MRDSEVIQLLMDMEQEFAAMRNHALRFKTAMRYILLVASNPGTETYVRGILLDNGYTIEQVDQFMKTAEVARGWNTR